MHIRKPRLCVQSGACGSGDLTLLILWSNAVPGEHCDGAWLMRGLFTWRSILLTASKITRFFYSVGFQSELLNQEVDLSPLVQTSRSCLHCTRLSSTRSGPRASSSGWSALASSLRERMELSNCFQVVLQGSFFQHLGQRERNLR